MSSGGHRAPKGSQEIADTRMVAPSCALVSAAGPPEGSASWVHGQAPYTPAMRRPRISALVG